MQLRIRKDSIVCKAIGARRGVYRIEHLHTRSFRLQNVIKAGDVFLEKIGTKENRADLGTKVFAAVDFERLIEMNSIFEFNDREKYILNDVVKKVKQVASISETVCPRCEAASLFMQQLYHH